MTYEIPRYPEGGRKEVFRWGPVGEKPVIEREIYRPGGEFDPAQPLAADLSARTELEDAEGLEAAGVIRRKFGTVALFRRTGRAEPASSCLGFARRVSEPDLLISGWFLPGGDLPARPASIGYMLKRLTLLTHQGTGFHATFTAECGPMDLVTADPAATIAGETSRRVSA